MDRENVGLGIIPFWEAFEALGLHGWGSIVTSAAVERVCSFFGNKFDDQNLASAQIKGGLHLKPPCCSTTINAPLHLSSSCDLLYIYSD